MLMENETLSFEDVAKLHGMTQQTIARWIHAFNKTGGGISVLKDKDKPGSKPRVSKTQLNTMLDVLKSHPREYGIKADKWEGSTLSELLKQKIQYRSKSSKVPENNEEIAACE